MSIGKKDKKEKKVSDPELLTLTAQLALALAKDVSDLLAITVKTSLVKSSHAVTIAGIEAGQNYQHHVASLPKPIPPEQFTGPPSIHIAIAMMQALVEAEEKNMEETMQAKVLEFQEEIKILKSMPVDEATSRIGLFRLVKINDTEFRKMVWKSEHAHLNEMWNWLDGQYMKGNRRHGSAPKGAIDRKMLYKIYRK